MKLKPLGDKVILQPVSEKEKTKSGIVLPDTVEKEKPEEGKVVAAGPGKLLDNGKRSPMDVKKGDVVLFKKYGFDDYEVENEKYLVGEIGDIVAIIEK